uniref:RRM domain-containing protein n=1 Tax=Oncorhynchus tshawytscha TaxID=74940 RepID=A0A8C8FLE7_ONCTS
MVKIFIGNLPNEVEKDELEALFTQHGAVTECAKFKNYAFVHMDDRKSATKANRSLHLLKLHGRPINVEPSRGKNQSPVKLHVANYSTVTECAVVKNLAFVHMSNSDEAMDAIEGLDNSDYQEISKRRPSREEKDYGPPPNNGAYWPAPHGYPVDRGEPEPHYYRGCMSGGARVVDYYEKYRARPALYGCFSGYGDERRVGSIPPPPPPSAMVRARLAASSLARYERHPLPPLSSYYARDHSPIRRPSPPSMPRMGNGYSYERFQLSPLSRNAMYNLPRSRDPYADRVPPLPPARYSY